MGGEKKLEEAIREIDREHRPEYLVVVSTCVPGIIGDDVDTLAERLTPEIHARILPVHCEGFKTAIWATAYDAVYHTIGRNLLDETGDAGPGERNPRLVNLMNVSSMGRPDELELERLLKALGLEVNIYPVWADPGGMRNAARAALSVSTCPTHDDYFLRHLQERYGVPYIIRHMPIGHREYGPVAPGHRGGPRAPGGGRTGHRTGKHPPPGGTGPLPARFPRGSGPSFRPVRSAPWQTLLS